MRSTRPCISLVTVAALAACGDPPPSAPPTAPPSANVGAARAGNGAVTYQVTPLGTLAITIRDPNGVRWVQVTTDATVEATQIASCGQQLVVSLTPATQHNHAHRVMYTDCQGRNPNERQRDAAATEIWDFPDLQTAAARTASQTDQRPHVTDNTGGTPKFYAVLVGHSFGGAEIQCGPTPARERRPAHPGFVAQLRDALLQYPEWQGAHGSITTLENAAAKRADMITAVNNAKAAAQPGEEFLFYFCDHGLNGIPPGSPQGTPADVPPADEPDGKDGRIFLAPVAAGGPADHMIDDSLAILLSGFRASVTITVVLDVCFAGDFVRGSADLLSATDATGARYDKDHLAILMGAGNECSFGDMSLALPGCLARANNTSASDINRDGITTAFELFLCSGTRRRSTPEFARGLGA